MTERAPEDETALAPTDIPAEAHEVTGRTPGGITVPSSDQAVQIAYLHSNRVSTSFHISMMNLIGFDKTIGPNVIDSMPYGVHCSGPNSLVEGRNMAVQHFLDRTESGWLMFIDTDMGFQPNSLEQLLFTADPVERPVVGGLCFAMKYMGPDGTGGQKVMPVPTLFMFAKNDKQGLGFANRFIYPPETMVQVAGTGAAFLLIHRSVLESVRAKEGDHWFDFVQYGDGVQVSEDLSFCWRLNKLGVPVYVHTGVKVTHHKELWLGEGDYHMPDREPMATMMAAAKPQADETGPPHPTCADVSTLGEVPRSRWICTARCPGVAE